MSMVLMQRKASNRVKSVFGGGGVQSENYTSKSKGKGKSLIQLSFAVLVVFMLSLFSGGFLKDSGKFSSRFDWKGTWIDEGIKIGINWNESSAVDGEVVKNLGPHKISVMTSCPRQVPYVYVSGDALLPIILLEKNHLEWAGEFTLPMTGKFELEIMSSRCESGEQVTFKIRQFDIIDDSKHSSADAIDIHSPINFANEMLAKGGWLSSSKLKIDITSEQPNKYVWMNPALINEEVHGIENANALVLKEGSVTTEHGFYEFQKLSNYELVCFFGSQSAKDLHESLLSLRGSLFPHQRPFKFHYYEVNDMVHPDRTWDVETKKKFRKCKHIIVSIDKPEIPLSQKNYTKQLVKLIMHLTKAFDDETFPIWVFTTMESPVNTKNCYDPQGLRSTEHPCNIALKKLFERSTFKERVRFLDNTDISLALPTNDGVFAENQKDALGAIALRIFIIVGYQVKVWRDNKQVGHINGLTRGDVEYPNFELIPYDFSSNIADSVE